MANNLKVVKSFGLMESGDTFKLSENGNYVSDNEWSHSANDIENSNFSSSVKQTVEISADYANALVDAGYLSEDTPFVNVFDEIHGLIDAYTKDLSTINKDYEDMPACLKIEKETVLSNMIKVLEHLYSLKK